MSSVKLFSGLLPHYFIFPCQQSDHQWNWESCDLLGDCSLWEYIDGTNLRMLGCSPFMNIKTFLDGCNWLTEQQRKDLKSKYKAMKSLFNYLHLTDLHSENFMIKGVKLSAKLNPKRKRKIEKAFRLNKEPDPPIANEEFTINSAALDLVPIDLECIDNLSKLSKKENEFTQELSNNQDVTHLISNFNGNIFTNPFRYIILGT